ncbi:MAG: glycosyltransferase family A protein [Actinomycetota bacterium]|nr:glycosyltransferase family A protein [Actinomycetota bacterium]
MVMATVGRAMVRAGTVAAGALAVHTAVNLRYLRRPDPGAAPVDEPVTVLIPARDEAGHVAATVQSVLSQTGLPALDVVVLDDGSCDATAGIVAAMAARDPRLRLVRGGDAPLPEGWLGKPWACARLADEATGTVLVFVDADVMLYPHAIRAAVATLRDGGFSLVAPYPLQLAHGMAERLVQPLVTWAWVATLPLAWAERSQRPSLSAANGQFLVLDAAAYRAIGGHAPVRADVLEDVGLMRAAKRAGHRTATVDGSHLAQCRMYQGTGGVADGYAKSLWSAFGGPIGSAAVCAALVGVYVVPAVAMVAARRPITRRWGLAGYAAGVASRAMVARRTGEPRLPDTFLQPLSIAAFTALNAVSWQRHLRGANTWKGRGVAPVRQP